MVISPKMILIAVHIPYIGNNTAKACYYSVALMGGNVASWMDHLEVWGAVPAIFPEFKRMFID